VKLCWNCGISDPIERGETTVKAKNIGLVLLIFGLIRLWIESRIKKATTAAPVSPGMVKADFSIIGSAVTTTYTFIAIGLLLYFKDDLDL
jgi:hypothetical protein